MEFLVDNYYSDIVYVDDAKWHIEDVSENLKYVETILVENESGLTRQHESQIRGHFKIKSKPSISNIQ